MNKKILILISFLVIISLTATYAISQIIYRNGKVKLDISLLPTDAKITINGNSVKSGVTYLKPGKYIIAATNNNYYEYRNLLDLKSDKNISINLKEKTDELISTLLYSNSNKAYEKYPILKKLSYNTFLLKINYAPESTLDSLIIDVKAYNGYWHEVIDRIKMWGYNPADYNIKFRDYENPFAL